MYAISQTQALLLGSWVSWVSLVMDLGASKPIHLRDWMTFIGKLNKPLAQLKKTAKVENVT